MRKGTLSEEPQAMSTWDYLCWQMGKIGGVGVDPKFGMRRRSKIKKKDHSKRIG